MLLRWLSVGAPTSVLLFTTVVSLSGCLDVRDFDGTWSGSRVGEAQELSVGMTGEVTATLAIEQTSLQSFRARLTTDNDVFDNALIQPIPGAEADVLSGMTFDGSPTRVYLAFAETRDGGGDAVVVVALYNDPRVEVRVLRGGSQPLYGIFVLARLPNRP